MSSAIDVGDIADLLMKFAGEESCKDLFWRALSFGRIREPLSLPDLPNTIPQALYHLEVFAASEAMRIVYASLRKRIEGPQIEQLAWVAEREVGTCVLILHDRSDPDDAEGWCLVYPDATKKPRIRMLVIPGTTALRRQTCEALAELAAENDAGQERDEQELYEELNRAFPGVTARLDQVTNDFADIAQHPDPQTRDLLPFYRDVGRYPLLTAEQERGEDLHGDEPPASSEFTYQQNRLIVHNLRLVLWQARKIPRIGMTLADLVQEGCFGLMTAAKKFDPDRGYRFSTFAIWWIRQAMYRGLHNQCNLIRWPVWRAITLLALSRSGRESDVPGERFVRFSCLDYSRTSLYGTDPFALRSVEQRCVAVRLVVDRLDAREKDVMMRRFGFDDDEETLERIGDSYNLTRERIRQVEKKAFERLRGYLSLELAPHMAAMEWGWTAPQLHTDHKRFNAYRDFMQGL